MQCMSCGCTDEDACMVLNEETIRHEPCHWVAPNLCSACRDEGIRLYEIATGRAA